MIQFLKTKISPVFAFIVVIVFGYVAITLMSQVYGQYANDQLLVKDKQAETAQ